MVNNAYVTVNDAAQLQCMKAVPFRTLENAVISTNAVFNRVVDSKPFLDFILC